MLGVPWCEVPLGSQCWQSSLLGENVEAWDGVSLLVGEDYIDKSRRQRRLRKGQRETGTQMPTSAPS